MTALDWQSPLDPPPPNEEVQVMLYDRITDDWRVDLGWRDADHAWRYANSTSRIGAPIGGWQPLSAVGPVYPDTDPRHWSRTGIAPWHVVVAERRDRSRMHFHRTCVDVDKPAELLREQMAVCDDLYDTGLDHPAAVY